MTPILGIMASSISGSKAITGAFYSIATATGTGSSATITFSSIPSTFKLLQIRINATTASAQGTNYLAFNGDTSGTNYALHRMQGNGTTVVAQGFTNLNNYRWAKLGSFATYPSVAIIDIQDYADTSKYKTIRNFNGQNDNTTGTTSSQVELSSGLWMSTSAITSIVISNDFNWTTGSTFALYGIN